MQDIADKTKKILVGAGALAVAVKTEIDVPHGEVASVSILGIPVFKRTEQGGLPVLFGIKFPRWIRGPRKSEPT